MTQIEGICLRIATIKIARIEFGSSLYER